MFRGLGGEPPLSVAEQLRRFNQEASLFVHEESSTNEDELSEVATTISSPRYRPSLPRKRQRVQPATVSMASSLPSPMVSPQARPQPQVRIKSEAETEAIAHLQRKPLDQRVKIYVDKNNVDCEVGLEDLDKSPVLKSLLNHSDVGTDGLFIMHPELTRVSADHFRSVREFLLTDEYMPAIIDNPRGEDVLPKRLDGCTSVEHYRSEARRGSHLYVIAKRLGMTTLQNLVYRKTTQAQFQPCDIKCLLDLAMIVFSRPEESHLNGKGKFKSGEEDSENHSEDAMEQWLFASLGAKFQSMMTSQAQLFFKIASHGACASRGFGLRVLRWKVENWEAVGADVIAIEDDE